MISTVALRARAAREYGVPWDVFPTLTPAQLDEIARDTFEIWAAKQKEQDKRLARLLCHLYRVHGAKDVRPEIFMPDYSEPKEGELTDEELEKKQAALFDYLQGMTAASKAKYGG